MRKMVKPFVKDQAKDFRYLTSISKKRLKRNEGRKSSNKRTKILTSKDKNLFWKVLIDVKDKILLTFPKDLKRTT